MSNQLNASDWIAICAGFIALLALGATLWQSYITHKHNHLSARPVLDIDYNHLEDEMIGICVKNLGPGPALILSVKATFQRKGYDLFKENEFQELLSDFRKNGLFCEKISVSVANKTSVIASGGEWAVLRIKDTERRREIAENFKRIMRDTTTEITYKSLYEIKYECVHKG